MGTHGLPQLIVVAACVLTAVSVEAEERERRVSGTVGVSTDSTFRGVSQTLGGPALQLSADLDLPAGFYAWLWASNVDFMPDGKSDDGADHEVDVALGYGRELGDDLSMEIELIRYIFPGTRDGFEYDYNELSATVRHSERYDATVAYSDDVDGSGRSSWFYRVGGQFDLSRTTTLFLDYGFFDLREAYGNVYSYTEASLSWQIGNATAALSFIDTHRDADAIYSELVARPRIVLSLHVDW